MTVRRLAAGILIMLGIAGCGGSGDAKVMPDVVGRQLDVAQSDVKSAGFKEDVEVVGGGAFGVVDESNWQVCDQSPAAGTALTATVVLTVDRSCGDEAVESTTTTAAVPSEPTTTAPSDTTVAPSEPTTTSLPEPAENLTAATNADLAAILIEPDYCSPTIATFASTYRGRTIEFDGHVAALAGHGNNKTRFDILVSSGDFTEPGGLVGPAFQFRDVNIVSDLNLTGPNIPDQLTQGQNLRVVAQVEDYNSDQCLLLLDPVTTGVR